MTTVRKALGGFGERSLDVRLGELGWSTFASNKRFRGGEIDRVYVRGPARSRQYCVAEVKTLRVRDPHHFATVLGGDYLRGALRPRQCRNLALWGRLLRVKGTWRVHVRVFRLFVFPAVAPCDTAESLLRGRFYTAPGCSGRVKVLRVGPMSVALCLSPEFVPKGQATSPLQVEIF